MTSIYLRLALLPVILITVVLLLIHVQPYDDHQLRQLLTPEGCPAPCFMGIRPGVTTIKEALAILQGHEWVADIQVSDTENPSQIWWTWNESAPDILQSVPANPYFPVDAGVASNENLVVNITFAPRFMVGDVVLALGMPSDFRIVLGDLISSPRLYVEASTSLAYEAQGFWASGTTTCPFASNLWLAPAHLLVTNRFYGLATGAVFAINPKSFQDTLRETSRRTCGK